MRGAETERFPLPRGFDKLITLASEAGWAPHVVITNEKEQPVVTLRLRHRDTGQRVFAAWWWKRSKDKDGNEKWSWGFDSAASSGLRSFPTLKAFTAFLAGETNDDVAAE